VAKRETPTFPESRNLFPAGRKKIRAKLILKNRFKIQAFPEAIEARKGLPRQENYLEFVVKKVEIQEKVQFDCRKNISAVFLL
jgi:hypothetical protein